MTPERLAEIRAHAETIPVGYAAIGRVINHRTELLAYVDELTRQLADARDKAINAGIFTSSDGDESKYTHALNVEDCDNCGSALPPVGSLFEGYCRDCDLEISTPGATSYKP